MDSVGFEFKKDMEEKYVNDWFKNVCGVIDEKNEIYCCVIEVEEGIDGSEIDFESNKISKWLVFWFYFIWIGVVMILVILF